MRRHLLLLPVALLAGAAACSAPPPPPPPPAPPPEPLPEVAWTARPEVALAAGGAALTVERPFSRLEVLGADSAGLIVRCAVCAPDAQGRVSREDLVLGPPPAPDSAAAGTLAHFALAVRAAAARRDLQALRALMAPDFSSSLIGPQTAEAALAAWRWEEFRTLDEVPRLLDQGLARLRGDLWVAPPGYQSRLDYRDLRLGFRRSPDGRWEWLFLIRGEDG